MLLTTLMTHAVSSQAAQGGDIVDYQIRQGTAGSAIISVQETTELEGSELVKVTSYTALEPVSATQREEIRLTSPSNNLVSYHYDDHATGEMWDVRVGDGQAKVELRSKAGERVDSKVIAWSEDVIVGRQIPDLILKNWRSLAVQGDTLSFDLYVPFRLEVIGFQVRVTSEDRNLDERNVTAEPRNWLLRKLAPSINFTIRGGVTDGSEPVVVRFRGPSPVDFGGVKNQLVHILF